MGNLRVVRAQRPVKRDRNRQTALYRLYAQDSTLLYVGISYDPDLRLSQHAAEKPWWLEVDHFDVEWFQFRELAEDAENVAIWEEHPRYNIARVLPRNVWRAPRSKHETVLAIEGVAELLPGAVEWIS